MRTCWRTTSCFATLDSTTRKFELPEGREITVTDTVGFIQKLPTTLIEAFKSTLDEITGADLVLHVVDASSDEYEAQIVLSSACSADTRAGPVARARVQQVRPARRGAPRRP